MKLQQLQVALTRLRYDTPEDIGHLDVRVFLRIGTVISEPEVLTVAYDRQKKAIILHTSSQVMR